VYPHAGFLLGVPILALANATKYASGLFDPVVVVLVGLVIAQRYGRRQGVRSAALFAAMLAAVLCAALAIAGHNYQLGIMGSTVARHGSGATTLQVLGQSVHWIGLLAALSLATAMACLVAWRRCRRDPGHESALGSSPLLVLVLAGAVVLAPLEQAHLHTTVSLHKHVAYGGWYASIAVGVLLSSISGSALRSWWRWAPVLAGVVGLLFIGRGQAQNSFGAWPNTTQLLASMQPYVAATANKPVLMDDSDVALYYLGAGYPIWHWSNTYYVQYQPPGATAPLLGEPALRSAIRDNHFGVVALDQRDPNTWMDQVAKQEIAKNPQYHYLGRVPVHDRDGADWYELWINRASESAR
jgi:hypothetical protein